MRVVVTGGAGFIGRATVRRLAGQGHDVVALVRDPDRAAATLPDEIELVRSDLSDPTTLVDAMAGADGVIHLAGSYRVGIRTDERGAMEDANVGATERVLDAAIGAGVARILYVSTVGTYGDTRGRIVDETASREPGPFISWYDETKFLAQEIAETRIASGAPVVIAQPGIVYGPDDHSGTGRQLELAYRGQLPYVALGNAGVTPVHVDDVAAGIVAALERGTVGERYILAGEPMRLRDGIRIAAEAGGHRPPRVTLPTAILRLLARAPEALARVLRRPDNLEEIIAAGTVTYWASSEKAKRELGFAPRPLAQGVVDAFGAAE